MALKSAIYGIPKLLIDKAIIIKWFDTMFTLSGNASSIFSSLGMKEGAKWQFWSKTQLPSSYAALIALSANSPYPYPSEIYLNLSAYTPILVARLFISILGSAPGDRIKMRGLSYWES